MKIWISLSICALFAAQALPAAEEDLPGLKYWNEIRGEAITTESGLQYKVRSVGKGKHPTSRSKVAVHYRGMLLNGVVFDTSYYDDEPPVLSLRSVIKGWREGIPLMPEGSVYVFLIPPELAYGKKGNSNIPPNATLLFEVELYDVK